MSEESFEDFVLERHLGKVEEERKKIGLSRKEVKDLLGRAIREQILKEAERDIRKSTRSIREQVRYLGLDAFFLVLKRTKAQRAKKNGRKN